jgi:predicted PolB exonuclease-like 3'-5' exonuclease
MVQEHAICVFDIETVPDWAALRRALRLDDDTPEAAVWAAWEAQAPSPQAALKPALQQVVAVAVAWIAPTGAVRRLTALGEPSWEEARLVAEFFRIIRDGRPRLVGWNSSGFDLPVLVSRAVVHGIPAPAFYQIGEPYHGYRRRFDEEGHLDLMDVLSQYGAAPRMGLRDMAAALGLPVKPLGTGEDVAAWWAAGDLARIRAYCKADVWVTAQIFARYAVHRGWWDEARWAAFQESLAEHQGFDTA